MPLEPYSRDAMPGGIYTTAEEQLHIRPENLWQVIGFIDKPAAVLRNLATGEKHVEIIGCPNAERFHHLKMQGSGPVRREGE